MLSSRACNWIWIENWIWNIDTDHIFNPHRSKPFKYTYEKEIVMYAYHKKLDYFSTECIYSPNAYRGHARAFIKDLEKIRPSTIIDIIHSGTIFTVLDQSPLYSRLVCWADSVAQLFTCVGQTVKGLEICLFSVPWEFSAASFSLTVSSATQHETAERKRLASTNQRGVSNKPTEKRALVKGLKNGGSLILCTVCNMC